MGNCELGLIYTGKRNKLGVSQLCDLQLLHNYPIAANSMLLVNTLEKGCDIVFTLCRWCFTMSSEHIEAVEDFCPVGEDCSLGMPELPHCYKCGRDCIQVDNQHPPYPSWV